MSVDAHVIDSTDSGHMSDLSEFKKVRGREGGRAKNIDTVNEVYDEFTTLFNRRHLLKVSFHFM